MKKTIIFSGILFVLIQLHSLAYDAQYKIDILAEPEYHDIYQAEERLYFSGVEGWIGSNNDWIIMNKYLQPLTTPDNPIHMTRRNYFQENMLPVFKDKKDTYLTTDGILISDYIYDRTANFCEGVGIVRKDGKVGAIDSAGNVVIDFIYDSISEFSDGTAEARRDGRSLLIDRSGNIIHELKQNYGFRSKFVNGYAFVSDVPVNGTVSYGTAKSINMGVFGEYTPVDSHIENYYAKFRFIDWEENIVFDNLDGDYYASFANISIDLNKDYYIDFRYSYFIRFLYFYYTVAAERRKWYNTPMCVCR